MSKNYKAKFVEDLDPYEPKINDICGVCVYDDEDEESLLNTIANVTRIFPVRWLTERLHPPYGTLFFFKKKTKGKYDSVYVQGQEHDFCIGPGQSIVQIVEENDDDMNLVLAKCSEENTSIIEDRYDVKKFVDAIEKAGIPVISINA